MLERALDRIFILHADHEQNASTSTVRLCGSSSTTHLPPSLPVWLACGACTRGANEACLNMLEDIQRNGSVAKVGEFMEPGQRQEPGVKLMGFGPVYKTTTHAPNSCRNLQQSAD